LVLDDIAKLDDAAKEKGYLTYNKVNDLIPHDVHPERIWTTYSINIGTRGIDVLEGWPSCLPLPRRFQREIPIYIIGLVC